MRVIKFRGIDDKGNWQYGTYYFGVMYPTSFRGHYINDWQIDEKTIDYSSFDKDCYDLVLQQFTGLKDKNGKEIYEGDIVKDFDINGNFRGIGYIEYSEWGYWVVSGAYKTAMSISFRQLEVIGNIYETPELLK